MERAAIVGTAQSWKQTPWGDAGLFVASLNDAYRLQGFVRADAWYDFHPLDRFYFTDGNRPIAAHQIPPGYYCRPQGHLEWLARQSQHIPVYLNPAYRTQYPAASTWPKAYVFPKAQVEQTFGRYFTSSPAWMLGHLLLQGVKELHVYGIHLATEFEYMRQRPNFEWLCGRLLGTGRITQTVKGTLRWYESQRGTLILPVESPILQESFQYAFDARPDGNLAVLQWDVHRFTVKRERAAQGLRDRPWWRSARRLQQEMRQWDAWLEDAKEALGRTQAMQQWK